MPIEIREISIKATVDNASKTHSEGLNADQVEEIIQEALDRFSQIQKKEAI